MGRDIAVVVDFLTAPPIAPSTTTNTLTIQCLLSDGVTTETKTYDTMLADGYAVQHQDRTAARWSQTFIYQGAYATEAQHIA